MTVSPLSATEAELLHSQTFTYSAIGATGSAAESPDGFATFTLTHVLNHTDFDSAAASGSDC